ncbi:hypothetical protein T06_12320 [Trichinella sp. T6]|nr:hypothetical protein T06_12320 [Trichinella sp. T6]
MPSSPRFHPQRRLLPELFPAPLFPRTYASRRRQSLCRVTRRPPASAVRFRTALSHVIPPRRVSTATDPPVALLMRPVMNS